MAGDIEVLPRRPRPNMRQELRASQRGRLICAVADAVAAKGYAATSVAAVSALAGVSRKAFYEHFEDKEACFLASYDTGAEAIHAAMVAAVDDRMGWQGNLRAGFTTWVSGVAAGPGLSPPAAIRVLG